MTGPDRRDRTGEGPAPRSIPKLCGADIELGNFILGVADPAGSPATAARVLLRQIDGLPVRRTYSAYGYGYTTSDSAQDWGRKFLPANGGCAYIDLSHLELCLPEVVSAYDHVACWHAMLRIAQDALEGANGEQPAERPIQVLVNNCDGRVSYGSHLNFMVTRRTWDNLFHRRLHQALYLAAYQTSSIIFTGQGKVGCQNQTSSVPFQISQRADWFETLIGPHTTFERPILNSRDEPLCGTGTGDSTDAGPARLHVIFFDNTLCHVSSLLKVGVTQMILAMIEADAIDPGLLLDDPLDAVGTWSHDPGLQQRARLASGQSTTAVELQLRFLEAAALFQSRQGFDPVVPRADEILSMWSQTLGWLEARDFDRLAPRLDWVLKQQILERALALNPTLDWNSPELVHLDYLYSSLNPEEGLYWAYERQGLLDMVVGSEEIDHFVNQPPDDTRAWTRAMLLRHAGPDDVDEVNWDRVRVRTGTGYWAPTRTLDMSNPLGHTRAQTEETFDHARSLGELMDDLKQVSPQFVEGPTRAAPGTTHEPTTTSLQRRIRDEDPTIFQ